MGLILAISFSMSKRLGSSAHSSLLTVAISWCNKSFIRSPASLRTCDLVTPVVYSDIDSGSERVFPRAQDKLTKRSPPLGRSKVPNFLCTHLCSIYRCKCASNCFNSHLEENLMVPSCPSMVYSRRFSGGESRYSLRKALETRGKRMARWCRNSFATYITV